jgi:hypothetical protein
MKGKSHHSEKKFELKRNKKSVEIDRLKLAHSIEVEFSSAISTTLMVNSADPAARWVWPTLTSRHMTGAVNLIKIPTQDP